MKKVLKIIGIGLAVIIALMTMAYLMLNEEMPVGKAGAEADALAESMMESLNHEAWVNTSTISWTFRGGHHYEWNKAEDLVTVSWDEHEVILNTVVQSGVVSNGQKYSYTEANELIKTAFDYFNNDSFWLAAPFKVFDPGTQRSIVSLEDGREGLMVTYTSGGSTPGDSYLWVLDENDRPVAIKMWAQILPVGGMEFSWENYLTLPSGAMVAQDHIGIGGMNVKIENIE